MNTNTRKKNRTTPVSEEHVLARERFRVELQTALHNLMVSKNVSQRELATRLGVSEARVSQIFGSQCNLTARTLGEVLHVLDCKPHVWVADGILRLTSDKANCAALPQTASTDSTDDEDEASPTSVSGFVSFFVASSADAACCRPSTDWRASVVGVTRVVTAEHGPSIGSFLTTPAPRAWGVS